MEHTQEEILQWHKIKAINTITNLSHDMKTIKELRKAMMEIHRICELKEWSEKDYNGVLSMKIRYQAEEMGVLAIADIQTN
jgi:hypothetical protein